MKKYNYYGWFCLLITVLTTALYIQQLDLMRLTYLSSSVIDNYDITAPEFRNMFSDILLFVAYFITLGIIIKEQLKRKNN